MRFDKRKLSNAMGFFFAVQSPITLERYKGKSSKSKGTIKSKMLSWQEPSSETHG